MAIDYKARERLIEEKRQKDLLATILERVKPLPEKPDTLTAPITKVSEGVRGNSAVSTILLLLVKKILSIFTDVAKNSPSSEDVQDVTRAVKAIKPPEIPAFPDEVTINPHQTKEIVSAIKGINLESPPAIQTKEIVNAIKDIKIPEMPSSVSVDNFGEIIKALRILPDMLESINKDRVSKITGDVKVKEMPKIDLSELVKAIRGLEKLVPKEKSDKSPVKIDLSPIVNAIKNLESKLGKEKPISFPEHISVDNFPPQMVPQPVTHISLNAMQGFAKTTAATVTSALTKLPTYGVLPNRRSLIIYNNSTNVIYVGGSDVTTSNGFPIPPSATSPVIDAGVNVIIYGIASSGNNNVRIIEISDDASGR